MGPRLGFGLSAGGGKGEPGPRVRVWARKRLSTRRPLLQVSDVPLFSTSQISEVS